MIAIITRYGAPGLREVSRSSQRHLTVRLFALGVHIPPHDRRTSRRAPGRLEQPDMVGLADMMHERFDVTTPPARLVRRTVPAQ
jgi:hypothetical protein